MAQAERGEIDVLLHQLSDLAYRWRSTPHARHHPNGQALVAQYHAVMDQLWATGWREHGLQVEDELPDDLLPACYREYWGITGDGIDAEIDGPPADAYDGEG